MSKVFATTDTRLRVLRRYCNEVVNLMMSIIVIYYPLWVKNYTEAVLMFVVPLARSIAEKLLFCSLITFSVVFNEQQPPEKSDSA
jgi:hypothetical protein